jgi:autotransporter translocation and assembly factor TamB
VLDRNVWVRHRVEPRLAVELTGAIDVRKPRYGPPGFYGRISTIPRRGFVEQFGRQFDVREGELSIAGDPSTLTFDVRGEYRATPSNDPGQTEIVVTLDIGGTPEKLSLTLGSEPELSNSEIVSLIATGSTEGFNERGSDSGGATAAGTAAEVGLASVTSAMTAGVEELAERAIGLDVMQIRQDGLRGTTLVAGKYVSPSLYVGFRQPVVFQEKTTQSTDSSDDFEVEAEYSVLDWLVLNLQGGGTVLRSYLRGRYAY